MVMKVELFLNELSIQGQFYDHARFEEAIASYIIMIDSIRNRDLKVSFLKSENFTNQEAIGGESFYQTLGRIRQKDIRRSFNTIIFEKNNPRNWEEEQKHDSETVYEFDGEDVSGTSVAELTERKLIQHIEDGALLNLVDSTFDDNDEIDIEKKEDIINTINIKCFCYANSLLAWVDQLIPFFIFEYSEDSECPPTDEQTILRDDSRFHQTPMFVQGRRVYQDNLSRNYYYVDNLHYGVSAHLEVFDRRKRHLGKAKTDGTLIPGSKILGRYLP
jgi:hypothetical protein